MYSKAKNSHVLDRLTQYINIGSCKKYAKAKNSHVFDMLIQYCSIALLLQSPKFFSTLVVDEKGVALPNKKGGV